MAFVCQAILLWTEDPLLQLGLLLLVVVVVVVLVLVAMVMLGGEQLGGIGGHHL